MTETSERNCGFGLFVCFFENLERHLVMAQALRWLISDLCPHCHSRAVTSREQTILRAKARMTDSRLHDSLVRKSDWQTERDQDFHRTVHALAEAKLHMHMAIAIGIVAVLIALVAHTYSSFGHKVLKVVVMSKLD